MATHRTRRIAAKVLLVLGCLLAVLANITVWLRLTALDTDRFVSTLEPLANDAQLDAGLAERLTDRIAERVDIEQRVENALPNDNPLVVATVTRLARTLVEDAIERVLRSDAFKTVWSDALRVSHERALDVIEGADGSIALKLTDALERADKALEKRGLDLFDQKTVEDIDSIVVARSEQIQDVRKGVDLLRKLAVVLPIAAVVVLAAAVLLALDRRHMLALVGIGVAVSMVLTGIALRITRRYVFDRIEIDVRRRAAEDVWSALAQPLFRQTAVIVILGLVLAAGAWLAGPSARTVKERGGPVLTALHDHLRPVQVAIAVVGVVALMVLPTLTVGTALAVLALVVLAVAALQVLAGSAPAARPA